MYNIQPQTAEIFGQSASSLTLAEAEKKHVDFVMRKFNGVITDVASSLGLSRAGLYGKLKILGFSVETYRATRQEETTLPCP